MEHQERHEEFQRRKWAFWSLGLGSLAWLALRSGTKPRRLAYPCQRVALANSVGFLGYLAAVLGLGHFYHRLKRKVTLGRAAFFSLALTLVALLTASNLPLTPVSADLTLPAWTSPTAISDVFVVSNVPMPECSLDGGTIPATAPCNVAAYALHDAGVDSLITEMEAQGTYFYRTTEHPAGIVAANDVVVIKINNQWAYNGTPQGRLSTNNDALKGVIWRIVQHPDTFTGEIVVAENTQGVVGDWDIAPANAQDTNQSYQDVIGAFQSLGYPVSLYRWDDLSSNLISGGDVGAAGYPTGEYANGDTSDAYILLEDPEGAATNELSYPKFQTTGGISVSMRYGVWNGTTYDADRLTLINMPVLKQHGMAGATIAWKNFIGFLTIQNNLARFGEAGDDEWTAWVKMHGYFWGYEGSGDTSYGLLGRQLAYIRTPDLNIVDAIWVADDNYEGTATQQNILLASTDPFAVDWYASEYILYALYANQNASAARGGAFRTATRVNQNTAAAEWPGTYPYIDLLDAYDGDTPNDTEKNQMNVYVVGGATACEGITDVGITGGPEVGYTGTPYMFTGVVTPTMASTPITYTWTPAPDSGQGLASATYTWDTPGVQMVSLLAENCGGSDSFTRTITIETPSACDHPLASARITGTTSGYTGTTYTFNVTVTPTNATLPFTYTWSPAPASGQGTASVGYTWATTGTHTINLTVENCGGSASPTHNITIIARPVASYFIYLPVVLRDYTAAPPVCAAPLTGVTISGPTSGLTNTTYTFTAAPTPANATPPIAYTWTPMPAAGQGTASVTYQWATTGSKTVSVAASHCSGAHTANDDHTITLQGALSGDLIQPSDLVYLGAFRLPDDAAAPRTFEYGGNAMTFNPDGHITNTDVHSGSLFITGHDRTDEHLDGDQVAEVSIPVPVNSRNVDDLPVAEFLQGFHDVTAGHFQELSTVPKVGLQYLHHTDTGALLHITWGRHLQQLEDFLPSQGWVSANLAQPNFQGEWFIGDQNPNAVNGYLLEIPAMWADAHAQGRYLATGRFSPGGLGGMGPTLLAYRPWLDGGAAPVSGTHLVETTLLHYESAMVTSTITHCLNDYQHADSWEGGAWLTTPEGKSAVLFAGTKATGIKYWYGYIHPTNPLSPCIDLAETSFTTCRLANGAECPETDYAHCCTEGDDCVSARGWWSTRHDAQLILYAPDDLAQVAAGTLESWEPQPYAVIDIDERLYLNPPEWDVFELGWGDQRRNRIGDVTYDRVNGYLYVIELSGDGAKPMVHIWQVQ